MKVAAINGSPRGKNSTTLHSLLYLEKHFPADEFEIIHVGQRIRNLERIENLDSCMDALVKCDLILFSYPVYTFLAPYQLHRFIELIKGHRDAVKLRGKKMTQITTSMHFYDMTAHSFMKENGGDLGFEMMNGFSAMMQDLLSAKGRKDIIDFWNLIHFGFENGGFVPEEPKTSDIGYVYSGGVDQAKKQDGFDTVVVTNYREDEKSLINMIDDFRAMYPYKTRLININDFPFRGGCLGCFSCASDGKCVYTDGFEQFLREEIQNADAIIYAASIKDHSLGSSFKLYDDRQFCNGHRIMTVGMPIGYILAGEISKEPNLKLVIESRCEVAHCFLAGVATDESKADEKVIRDLSRLSKMIGYALANKFIFPQNFYGVGGMKIFRDLIYVMQGLMKADHKHYKKHGVYDFPQKKIGQRILMHGVGLLASIPMVRKKIKKGLDKVIISPYKKVIKKY
jgi:multimeric flavodoxin WrbA